MNDLDRSIIATLAYYGAFGWPLTFMEVYERRIPAHRVGGRQADVMPGAILERLERLTAMELVVQDHGLYALAGTSDGFVDRRIAQEKIWAQKWRKMLRRARWLQMVPFVRGLYASGSLALGNMSPTSDWDMFVIAEKGRLYTARIGLLMVARLMGALRTKHDEVASDAFCFNHYVTTDGLTRRHRSLYVAHGLAVLVPIFDPRGYLERLWQANQWIGDYLAVSPQGQYVRRSVTYSRIFRGVQRLGELVFGWLEFPLRRWQQRRVAAIPATYERGGRVVSNLRELEFHPRSFEAIALSHYNATLVYYGLAGSREQDSGLTR